MSAVTTTQNDEHVDISRFYAPLPQSGVQDWEGSEPAKCWETILLVEDDDNIRDVTRKILEMHGYTVLTAGTATEGIHVFEQHEGQVDLLVTDVMMPGMNGRELVRRLTDRCPELKAMFISGYDSAMVCPGMQNRNVTYLQKPFTVDELARKVRELIDGAVYPGETVRVN